MAGTPTGKGAGNYKSALGGIASPQRAGDGGTPKATREGNSKAVVAGTPPWKEVGDYKSALFGIKKHGGRVDVALVTNGGNDEKLKASVVVDGTDAAYWLGCTESGEAAKRAAEKCVINKKKYAATYCLSLVGAGEEKKFPLCWSSAGMFR